MPKNINLLLDKFNLKVNNLSLFEFAFTHSSCNSNTNGKHIDYERLEFIGDSVVGLITVDIAFKLHPNLNQGSLTKLKHSIVDTKSLSNYALKYHFDEFIHVGNSYPNDIKKSHALLEDVFESFMGAIYIDQGFDVAYKVFSSIVYDDIKNYKPEEHIDYKSSLQEEIQAESRKVLTYVVVSEKGPAHQKTFEVNVIFDNMVLGTGVGSTKKEAEQAAAKSALNKRALR